MMSEIKKGKGRNECMIATRIPRPDYEWITVQAQNRGLTVSSYVRQIISQPDLEPEGSLVREDNRTEHLSLRVSKTEREELESNATRARMTTSAYVRARCIYSDIPLVDVDDETLVTLLRELAHEGNNLNQIAHRLNTAQEQELSQTVAGEERAIANTTYALQDLMHHIEILLNVPRR
jgi:hypothetical protein